MSIIYNYPTSKPYTTDLLVGTAVFDDKENPIQGNPTRNFSVGSIGEFVNETYGLKNIPKYITFTMTNAMIKAGAGATHKMVNAPGLDRVIIPVEMSATVIQGSDTSGITSGLESYIGDISGFVGKIPIEAFDAAGANEESFFKVSPLCDTSVTNNIGAVIPINSSWVIRTKFDLSGAGFNGEVKLLLGYQIFNNDTRLFEH